MEENTTTQPESNKNSSQLMIVGVILLVGLVSIPLLMKNGSKNSGETAPTPTAAVAAPSPAVEAMETEIGEESSASGSAADLTVKSFELEAGSFYYKPNVIKVKKGDKVKVTINSVSMMHDFVIDELGVKIPVTKSGESNFVEFTADKVGEFEFYCSVGQHKQMGQVGTLIVE